jgi:YfiH family protein
VPPRVELVTAAPETLAGIPAWRFEAHGACALFLGRGAPARDAALPAGILPAGVAPAWLRQVHSARVLDTVAGACGEGDALVTGQRGLAATVASADCVPVLISTPGAVGAVHAGWRGVAAGIIPAALARMSAHGGLERGIAWVGPAIGACCYEVGEEVAARVVEAAGAETRREGRGARPHLDLAHAVAVQLAAAGIERIVCLGLCTRCRPEWLWSHRRDGEGCGRNLSMIWRGPG